VTEKAIVCSRFDPPKEGHTPFYSGGEIVFVLSHYMTNSLCLVAASLPASSLVHFAWMYPYA
jgi:hypothetical protein